MCLSFLGVLTGSLGGLYYIATEYPELLPSVIGLLFCMYGVGFVVNKLVDKATGVNSKDDMQHSKNNSRNS